MRTGASGAGRRARSLDRSLDRSFGRGRRRGAAGAARLAATLAAVLLGLAILRVAGPRTARGDAAAVAPPAGAARGGRPGRAAGWAAELGELRPATVVVPEPAAVPVSSRSDPPASDGGSIRCELATARGAPIPAARVRLLLGAHELAAARTDESGAARFADLPPGYFSLVVDPAGWPEHLLAPERASLLLARGAHAEAALRGERPAHVEGYVKGPLGEAVAGALVRLQRVGPVGPVGPSKGSESPGTPRSAAARTDERGHYELADLRPGRYRAQVVLSAEHVGARLAPPWPRVHELGGGTTALDLRLEPAAARIEGRVVDEAGAPLAGLTVLAELDEGPQDGPGEEWSRVLARGMSDEGGRFALAGLPAAPVAVRVLPAARSPGPFRGGPAGRALGGLAREGGSRGGLSGRGPRPAAPEPVAVDLSRAQRTVDLGALTVAAP